MRRGCQEVIALDIYRFCLLAGVIGIACMGLLGVGHLSLGHGAHHSNDFGDGHAPGSIPGHGMHAGHGANGRAGAASGNASIFSIFLGLLSPRVLFSLSLGFGLSGTLLKYLLAVEPARLLLALCGAALFEGFFVRPLWNLAFRFASNPARTLENAQFEEGRAVTDFDASGHGLIAIDLDGQVMQVLGVLKADERGGARVRTGEKLLIEEIDTARNRCTVSRLRG